MVLTIGLLVVILMSLIGCAFGAFFYLLKHPPVVRVQLGEIDLVCTVDVGQMIPSPLVVQTQVGAAPQPPTIVQPLPADILDYIDMESEEYARQLRRARARALYQDSGDWEYVLNALKREDGVLNEIE